MAAMSTVITFAPRVSPAELAATSDNVCRSPPTRLVDTVVDYSYDGNIVDWHTTLILVEYHFKNKYNINQTFIPDHVQLIIAGSATAYSIISRR